MNMGERIVYALKHKGITPAELSRRTKISKSSLSQYINNKVNPKQDNLYLIAKTLDINLLWLLGVENEPLTKTSNNTIDLIIETAEQLTSKRQTSVLEFTRKQLEEQNSKTTTSTNTFTLEDSNISYMSSYNFVYVTETIATGISVAYGDNEATLYKTDRFDLKNYDFATLVHGDSMEPKYRNGDIVLIKSGYDNVNGAVYVVDYAGKSFLKRVFFEGNRLRLVSYNHQYKDIYIDLPIDDDVYLNIIGKVIDSFTPIYD
ncbi:MULTISPECIES: XRE family transcriptional regulator [unclassified Granulicatella]|uniref:XRE family transcriptional regulator n=1 Tax=unclassified Granulicatella TaxID=2630493 RepID=UPI00107465FD|nr:MULTISPECIES: XRE family transcriptional regulator [unclassified Granulicatella]MBF0780294.1 helix-turn-helix transcriptional regulator [Granulicatella sp. 19428wC4_WM01]TFU95572.1 XRE family transcriptional regulator [Granulicatella sp. WM01]